jgi:WhiB family redox-sensing transcriptional regulator
MDTDWRDRAACRTVPTAVFFPERFPGDPGPAGDKDIAKAVCASCPVKAECDEDQRGEQFGVRAGTTARERKDGTGNREKLTELFAARPEEWFTITELAELIGRPGREMSVRATLNSMSRKGEILKNTSTARPERLVTYRKAP